MSRYSPEAHRQARTAEHARAARWARVRQLAALWIGCIAAGISGIAFAVFIFSLIYV